jgi:FAD/FMN-containing dehydrogenase
VSLTTVGWDALFTALDGDLVLPTDGRYELARQLQLAEYDRVGPGAVAYCASTADVRACVSFAAAGDLHLAVRSGGHNFAGWSTTTGLVVDLSRMDTLAADGPTVRVGPGVQAVDSLIALAPQGRTLIGGICPTVCPVGFVSGGGVGWQTRRHGLAADHLVSATVVLADGRVVTCSAQEEPDLFWALRGGGAASFGVVVELELAPVEAARLVSHMVIWPGGRAVELLSAWQRWMARAPRELVAEIGFVLEDAGPDAAPVVLMFGATSGPRAEFEAALADLCAEARAEPMLTQIDELPHEAALLALYRCQGLTAAQRRRVGTTPEAVLPRQPYARERHRLLAAALPDEVLARAFEIFDADRRAGQLRNVALAAVGGAAGDVGGAETAYPHRDAEFLAKFTLVGLSEPTPGDLTFAEGWTDRGFELLDPHSTHGSYLNYPDPALRDWPSAYHGDNYPRLLEVKRAYDPAGFFRHAQSVGSHPDDWSG